MFLGRVVGQVAAARHVRAVGPRNAIELGRAAQRDQLESLPGLVHLFEEGGFEAGDLVVAVRTGRLHDTGHELEGHPEAQDESQGLHRGSRHGEFS